MYTRAFRCADVIQTPWLVVPVVIRVRGAVLTSFMLQRSVAKILKRVERSNRARNDALFCFLEPFARTAYLPWLSGWSPAENDATKWLTQELIAHNVMVATTVWVSPLIITVELVMLTLFCFSRNLSMTMSVTFCRTDHTKEKSWHSDSDGRKNVTKHVLVTPIVLIITSDYYNCVRDADIVFVSVRFFYDINIDILQHWKKHLFIVWSIIWSLPKCVCIKNNINVKFLILFALVSQNSKQNRWKQFPTLAHALCGSPSSSLLQFVGQFRWCAFCAHLVLVMGVPL